MKLEALVERIAPATTKMQENLYVKSMMGGFMATMPVLMFGALCSMIVGFPVEAWTTWVKPTALGAALQAGVDGTTNLLAVYVVLAIGYNVGKNLNKDVLATAVSGLLAFLLVTPFTTTLTDAAKTVVPSVIPMSWLGPQGVFTAIVTGLLAPRIFAWVVDRGWKIVMPDSVPPAVSRPFEAIVPFGIIGALFLLVRAGFAATPYGHFGAFLYTTLAQPLAGLGNSFWAWVVIFLVVHILWLLGIHGTLVAFSVLLAVLIGPATENQAAGAAGQPLPYLLTITFGFAVLQWIGGPGNLLGLSTNMLLAKSQRYKSFGRIAFLPSVFNIIEPIIFGFPLVFNPLMAIPFILTPLVNLALGYMLMASGIIAVPWVALPFSVFTMPVIPGGFLLGGGWTFGVFMIVAYLISVVIYLPFFRVADRQALAEERAVEASEAQLSGDVAVEGAL
jgi:PTS system cellobiose-specific IIC component